MVKALIIFFICIFIIVFAKSQTLDELYRDDIAACIEKGKAFSFDTLNCVDINISINSEHQTIIDSIFVDPKNQK